MFNNLDKNPENYFNNFFSLKSSSSQNSYYPPRLIIYEIQKKINLEEPIEKYIKSYLNNSYSDYKQKKIYRYYQSEHNLHKLKNFKFLANILEKELNKKKNLFFFPKKNQTIKIDKMWFVKSKRGVDLLPHNHPEGIISGIYYYKVPKKKSPGILRIENPKNNIKIIGNSKNILKKNRKILIKPIKNSLIVFNSYLMHSVIDQASDEDRVSIPFDANIFNN
tara:strand:- start:898 stop:1560 length:663 start_codon:yes stop_codon:yes gene_type:complete